MDSGSIWENIANSASEPSLAEAAILRTNNRDVAEAIRKILDDTEALRRTTCRARVHPNGFVRFVLHERETILVRLHVWLDGSRSVASDIHSHCSWTAVKILSGGYTETRHVLSARADERSAFIGTLYEYPSWPTAGTTPRRIQDTSYVSDVASHRRKKGDVFVVDPEVLHRVAHPDEGTVSLVVQGPLLTPWTRIVTPKKALDGEPSPPIGEEEGRRLLNASIETLEARASKLAAD